jgi:HD-like signal output (HDOD) protein
MDMIETRIPDISTLRRIKSAAGLSDDHLIALANQLEVYHADKQELLLNCGSVEKTSLYIVKGQVSLNAQDGKTRLIMVDETQELKPVAQLRPCIYDVRALGPVDYMKIDTQRFADFVESAGTSPIDISVHTLFNDEDEDNSIVNHLYHNLMDKSILLPDLPSVAGRIQRIYDDESTDVNALVRILISYPDVARKIKNVARYSQNFDLSVTEKTRRSIEHLGILAVYCLIMTYSVGKLVKRLPRNHMQLVSSFWDHSLNVAAISRILAKNTRLVSPDLAMLAGLIHGIGVLVIDDFLLQHSELMLDHLEIDHAIQVLRPEISSLLLRKWDFRDDLILVAEECGDWSRDKEGPADLCDLVLVANYLGLMKNNRDQSLPHVDSMPAIGKLGITPEESIDAIKESAIVRKNIEKLFS